MEKWKFFAPIIKWLKCIKIDLYFRKSYMFSTPYFSCGYCKHTPFADWCIDIHIGLIFWHIDINIDNMYKYYQKYKKK